MSHLVLLLEEPSAREMLNGLLPRLYNNIDFRCIVFAGKQDLEKNLVRKIKGYRVPNSRFIVLRDQDAADCMDVKNKLIGLCHEANRNDVVIRIACRELESWYLGDLQAVESGLNLSNIAKLQNKKKYRLPDLLHSPSTELERLTNKKYQNISGSRSIGPYLSLNNNCSNSFRIFIDGIKRLVNG
ncbi:MAG: DUF4276 family protein [bacterium]